MLRLRKTTKYDVVCFIVVSSKRRLDADNSMLLGHRELALDNNRLAGYSISQFVSLRVVPAQNKYNRFVSVERIIMVLVCFFHDLGLVHLK